MKKTMDEINKMIMEDAPMEEVKDAIGYVDITSCFDPVLSRPSTFGRMPKALGSSDFSVPHHH